MKKEIYNSECDIGEVCNFYPTCKICPSCPNKICELSNRINTRSDKPDWIVLDPTIHQLLNK